MRTNSVGKRQETTHSVEDVHQLATLHRANHDRPALRIRRQVLTGDDTPRTGTTVRLLMQLVEDVVCRVELEDDYPARVRADNEVVCGKNGSVPRLQAQSRAESGPVPTIRSEKTHPWTRR